MQAEKTAHELVAEPPTDFRLHEPVLPFPIVRKIPSIVIGGNIHCPFRRERELDAGVDSGRRIIKNICLERYILPPPGKMENASRHTINAINFFMIRLQTIYISIIPTGTKLALFKWYAKIYIFSI